MKHADNLISSYIFLQHLKSWLTIGPWKMVFTWLLSPKFILTWNSYKSKKSIVSFFIFILSIHPDGLISDMVITIWEIWDLYALLLGIRLWKIQTVNLWALGNESFATVDCLILSLTLFYPFYRLLYFVMPVYVYYLTVIELFFFFFHPFSFTTTWEKHTNERKKKYTEV